MKRFHTLSKWNVWVAMLALCVCLSVLLPVSASADTLSLPSGLKTIEAEAFYGDNSLNMVVLPDGITTIGSKAFKNSSVKNVNLPDSLTSIANDAFDGPEKVSITANAGTYAYDWAVSLGYLLSPVQGAPTGLKNKVKVNWNEVTNAVSYSVYYGTSNDISSAIEITGIEGTTSYTIENLLSGTRYYTWVKAVNSNGVSATSNRKSVLTKMDEPSFKTITVIGNTIALSWDSVSGTDLYRIYYNTTNNVKTATLIVVDKNSNSYTITDLNYYSVYYIWIAAANASEGIRSKAYTATIGSDMITPTQKNLIGRQKKVIVSWDAVENANSYTVYYSTTNDLSSATEITGIEGTTEYTIANLLDGTMYYTWVRAINENGISDISNVKSAITYAGAPNKESMTVAGNSIALSWNMVTGASYYKVRYNVTKDPNTATAVNVYNTSYTITNLEYASTYYVWVTSMNSSGGTRIYFGSIDTESDPNSLTITTHPTSQSVSNGDSVTMQVAATGGTGSYSYQWYRAENTTVTGSKVSTSKNYTFTASSTYDGYYYYCVVTSGTETVTSDRAELTIVQDLTITTHPTSQSVSDGDSVTMRVAATGGTGSYSYQWYRAASTAVIGSKVSTSKNYTFTASSTYDGYYYYCVVTSGSESAPSNRAKLTVTGEPEPYGDFNKTSITLTQGETASFSVSGGVENSTSFVYTVNGARPDGSELDISAWSGISVTGQSTFSKTFTINATSTGDFYTPGTYTLNLWVRDSGTTTGVKVDSMTVTVNRKATDPVFTGGFSQSSKTLYIGDTWIVEANVSVSGGSGYLGIVTINTSEATLSDNFVDHNVNEVYTQYWGAYTIDTSVSPWNTPGTYTLRLWAKDTNGNGGTSSIDTMTLKISDDSDRRQAVVDYAYNVYNYTWSTSGNILVYYNGYNPTTTSISDTVNPVVVSGTVRGIPYSLSANGDGAEKTFSAYKSLSSSEKLLLSNRYSYNGGYRVSMKYGMSCATFVTECMLQGLPGKGLSTYAVTNIHSQSKWKNYITQGSKTTEGYKKLQKGDYLYSSGHVMLVVDNNGSSGLTVIEQTPPDYSRINCSNKKTVTVCLTYNGTTKSYTATQLCMNCDACKQTGVGTQKKYYSYSNLSSYTPMYVDYSD